MPGSDSFIKEFYFSSSTVAEPRISHSHKFYQIIMITKGKALVCISEKEYECSAPSLIFIRSFEPHSITPVNGDYSRYVMAVDPSLIDYLPSAKNLDAIFKQGSASFSHHLILSEKDRAIEPVLASLLSEYRSDERPIEGGLSLLFSTFLYLVFLSHPALFKKSSNSETYELISAIKGELEANYSDRILLSDIAKRYHISKYYLSHIFKEQVGYSPKEYIMMLRISASQKLLVTTNRPIREIAFESGFSDLSNFSRSFKSITGVSPSDFREKGARPSYIH
ncbi:MAG: AraC family transcriptional regulator [Clostridia bacterium]|nr:AraC family transcriptional regulator [Clostridia bacterium]